MTLMFVRYLMPTQDVIRLSQPEQSVSNYIKREREIHDSRAAVHKPLISKGECTFESSFLRRDVVKTYYGVRSCTIFSTSGPVQE